MIVQLKLRTQLLVTRKPSQVAASRVCASANKREKPLYQEYLTPAAPSPLERQDLLRVHTLRLDGEVHVGPGPGLGLGAFTDLNATN